MPHRETDTVSLPPDHYRVFVSYAPLPPISELEQEFGKDNVSILFNGRPWKKHYLCVNMDETPGERVMLVKPFGKSMESDQTIAWGEENSYRPATHLEAIEFARAYPDLQRAFWIAALGSFAVGGGSRCVAVLRSHGSGRVLGGGWFDAEWRTDDRFLFVRKS